MSESKKSLKQTQRQDLARMYFMQGMTQKDIAENVGVSRNTICAWIKEGRWDTMRAATTVSRKELVTKLLQATVILCMVSQSAFHCLMASFWDRLAISYSIDSTLALLKFSPMNRS